MPTSSEVGQAYKTAVQWIKRILQPLLRDGLQWARRPAPFWALFLVAALGAFALSRMSGSSDQAPKRWSSVKDETPTQLYDSLVNPPPPPCDLASPPCNADGPLSARHHDWNKPHVAVYSVAATPRPLPTLRDLGDRGQAQAIALLGKTLALEGKSWTQLRDALSVTGTAGPGEKDPFQFDRVLVATVAKGASWDPGDRMMWTRVFVQPINFSFAGYTVAATDNETVKVTSVEATNSRKFSADIGLTVPGLEGPKASVGPSDEHSVKTTSDISAQYEKLGIDIMPHFLRIIRESETGGDVVGNTTVSLSVVTDALAIQKRFPKDESQKLPLDDDIVLLVTATHLDGDLTPVTAGQKQTGDDGQSEPPLTVLPQIPVPHCALRARVWMLYEERHVDNGREFYDESRQAVTLLREAEDKEDLDIMAADEVSPAVWSLQICDGNQCDRTSDNPLKASLKNGKGRKVVFTDYGQAIKLAHWLRTNQQNTIPGSSYTFNYPDNNSSNSKPQSLIPIKKLDDECKPKTERISSR
jgi:hypothetical protein